MAITVNIYYSGVNGSVFIDFKDSKEGTACDCELITVKNRLCCSDDSEPLITLLDKKLAGYDLKITCKACGNTYAKVKKTNLP